MSEDTILGLLSDLKAQLDRIEALLAREEKVIRDLEELGSEGSFSDVDQGSS